MKKTLLWILILAMSILMVSAFSLTACKTTATTEATTAAETTAAETTAAETTAAETTAAEITGNLVIWDYTAGESERIADKEMLDAAIEEFQAKYPKVTVDFQLKTFEQIQKMAKMVLNSDDAPDVMEINSGKATIGLYVTEGLITDITSEAQARGWDKIMPKSFQYTCLYDEDGNMGSGNLYGITYSGAYVGIYYNKDMFEQYGLEVPTSLEEFEAVCDKFVEEGIVPITVGGLEQWPLCHNWWEMVLYKADRQLLDDFYGLKNDVDFQGEAFTFGAEKIIEYLGKGYFGSNTNGTSYTDANVAFAQGINPMNLTGNWAYGNFMDTITDFDWGIFLMPGKTLVTGSGGGTSLVIPEKAKNKELAMDFLGIVIGENAQSVFANAGGVPFHADLTKITDPKLVELNEAFNTIIQNDGIGFYPDWAIPGFLDVMGASLQDLFGGNLTAAEFNDSLSKPYYEYKSSVEQ